MPRRPEISVRMSVQDHETVKRALVGLGRDGQAALKKIETTSQPASRGLLVLNAAAREGRSEMEHLGRRGGVVSRVLGSMGPAGIAAAAGVGALVLALGAMLRTSRQATQDMDALVQASERLGIGIESLQELREVARLNRVEVSTMEIAVQRLGRRMGEVARGGAGEVKQAFDELGVSITTADGQLKTVDEILPEVADGLAGVEDGTVRLSLAQKLFDSEGVVMVNVLQAGSRALEEQRQRARDLGIVWDEELVRRGAELNREMDTLATVIDRQLKAAFIELAPAITAVLGLLADIATQISDVVNAMRGVASLGLDQVERQITRLRQQAQLDPILGTMVAQGIEPRLNALLERRAELLALAEGEDGTGNGPGTGTYTPPAGDGEVQSALAARYDQVLRDLEAAQLELDIVGMREEAQVRERALLEARRAALQDFEAGLRDSSALTTPEENDLGFIAEWTLELEQNAARARAAAELIGSLRDDLAQAESRAGLVGLSGTALAAARAELQVMNRLRERGITLTAEDEAEVRRLTRAIAATTAETERQADVAGRVGDAFTSSFEAAILRGEDLRSVLSGILQDLARIAAQQSVLPIFGDVLGNLIPGTGGPAPTGFSDVPVVATPVVPTPGFASGGIYGEDFRHVRQVPVSAFLDAPRFGMGGIFEPGSGPAILHRHEEVLTPDNPRHRDNIGAYGGMTAIFHINLDGATVQDPATAVANADLMGRQLERHLDAWWARMARKGQRAGGVMNETFRV